MRSTLLGLTLIASAAVAPAYAAQTENGNNAAQQSSHAQKQHADKTASQSAHQQQENVAVNNAQIQNWQQNSQDAQATAIFKNTGSQDLYITSIKTASAESVTIAPANNHNNAQQSAKSNEAQQNQNNDIAKSDKHDNKNYDQAQNNKQDQYNKSDNQQGWKLAAGQSTEFSAEKGNAIIIKGLKKALKNGEQVAFNITYSDGSQQKVNFTVSQNASNSLTN